MQQFLLQMAGWMGSGKSTITNRVSERTGAVVLDHDTTKSAILSSGSTDREAGRASYAVLHALAADLLAQGHSVVIDSPSLYDAIPATGARLAAATGARYLFVECECPSELAAERLGSRAGKPSQVRSAEEASAIRSDPNRSPVRPEHALLLNTTGPVEASVASVLELIGLADPEAG